MQLMRRFALILATALFACFAAEGCISARSVTPPGYSGACDLLFATGKKKKKRVISKSEMRRKLIDDAIEKLKTRSDVAEEEEEEELDLDALEQEQVETPQEKAERLRMEKEERIRREREERFRREELPTPPKPKRDRSKLKTWDKGGNMLFHAEEAYVQKAGTGRWLFGYDYATGHYLDRLSSTPAYEFRSSRSTGSVTLSYGLWNSAEFTFFGPVCFSQAVKDEAANEMLDSGIGDAQMGARLRILKENKGTWYLPTVTLGAGVSLPLGSEGVNVYDTSAGFYFTLHASREFEDFALNLSFKNLVLNGSKFGDEEVDIYEIQYGMGLTLYSGEDVNLLFEVYGEKENAGPVEQGRMQSLLYVSPGVEFNWGKDRAMGVSFFRSLSEDGFDYGIGAKLHMSF